MSAMNLMNDQGIAIKSSLVQIVQDRHTDINRSQHLAAQAFQEELARQAEETVEEVHRSEQEGIRGELGDRQQPEQKRRKRREKNADDDKVDGWVVGADDDGQPHLVNVLA